MPVDPKVEADPAGGSKMKGAQPSSKIPVRKHGDLRSEKLQDPDAGGVVNILRSSKTTGESVPKLNVYEFTLTIF